MKYTLLLFSLVLSLGAAELREYPFFRQVVPGGSAVKSAAIALDEVFYSKLNDTLSNIQLLDDEGNTIPFALREHRNRATVTDWMKKRGKITGFSRDFDKNTATLFYELEQPAVISRMTFLTSDKRFNKKIDLLFETGNGKSRRESAVLYKYEDIYGGAHVDFPPLEVKRFSAVIHNFAERQEGDISTETSGKDEKTVEKKIHKSEFELEGVSVFEQITRTAWLEPFLSTVSLPEIRRETQNKKSIITVNGCRVPCKELVLKADDPRFSRSVEIFADGEVIASGEISENTPVINLPEERAQEYVIVIDNQDNAPLKNITLQWKAKKQILLFIPPAKGNIRVFYGGNAPAFKYDIENYAGTFTDFPEYLPGKEEVNPAYAPAFQPGKLLTPLLWVLLGVTALILGVVIFKLLRYQTVEAEPPQE